MKRSNIEDLGDFHYLVHGRHGHFLANKNDVYVGGALITYGEFSELETEVFRKFIDKNTTVVEVGANIGAHTVWLAKNARKVIAIEPQPFIYYTLCAQIVLNSLQNVRCINAGCGEHSGTIEVPVLDYSKKDNYGGIELERKYESTIKVPLITLDSLLEDVEGKVFLKIDVEGMELSVLKGGLQLIDTHKPIMYVENDRADKSKALLDFIHFHLGYKIEQHVPFLFNEDNFFRKGENKYPTLASFNEICYP